MLYDTGEFIHYNADLTADHQKDSVSIKSVFEKYLEVQVTWWKKT